MSVAPRLTVFTVIDLSAYLADRLRVSGCRAPLDAMEASSPGIGPTCWPEDKNRIRSPAWPSCWAAA